MKKKIRSKAKPKVQKTVPLTITTQQIAHMVEGAVKNMMDLRTHIDDVGVKFLLILDCVSPDDCIPVNQEPKNLDEEFDIILSHSIPQLAEFIEVIIPIKHSDGKLYRGFSTEYVNLDNMANFIAALSQLDQMWAEMDQIYEEAEEVKRKTTGKNVVEGNNTVN